MSIPRIGINPLTWTNDDLPSLGAETSLETCLSEAKLAGYDGMELGNKFPRDPAVLGPILTAHQLALVSGWYSLKLLQRDVDAELAAMEPHFNLLSSLGSNVMVVCEVTDCIHGDQGARLSRRPHMAPSNWVAYGERLGALARRMRARGMHLAYHHHMGTVVQSAADIDLLMQHTPPEVELLLDTGHLTFAGGDPVAFATKYAHRIAHVHCKDVRPEVLSAVRNRDSSFLDAVLQGVFTVPGDGSIDYRAVLAPIAKAGYQGWLVVEAEQDPAIAEPLRYARMGHAALSRLARELWGPAA